MVFILLPLRLHIQRLLLDDPAISARDADRRQHLDSCTTTSLGRAGMRVQRTCAKKLVRARGIREAPQRPGPPFPPLAGLSKNVGKSANYRCSNSADVIYIQGWDLGFY